MLSVVVPDLTRERYIQRKNAVYEDGLRETEIEEKCPLYEVFYSLQGSKLANYLATEIVPRLSWGINEHIVDQMVTA